MHHETGESPLAVDPRFSFAWRKAPSGQTNRPLLVVIHGSERDHVTTRDAFAELATQCDVGVLAPLFPAGVITPQQGDGYKFLQEPGADYAVLFDAMLSQHAGQAPFDRNQLYLFGFSGGAQFAHRYAIIHASRLAGLIVAAPGNITLLDGSMPWWAGTGNIEQILGWPGDTAGLARLRAHFIVGSDDLTAGLVTRNPGEPYYSPQQDLAGPTRRQRLEALAGSFAAAKAQVSTTILDEVGHELTPLAQAAAAKFARWLA